MRRCNGILISLITASLAVLGTTSANALIIDARIGGIFTDTTFLTPVAGVVIDAAGDVYGYEAQAGQGVLVTIDVANPSADLLDAIFVTLVVQSTELNLLGSNAAATILTGGTILNPTSLDDIASGMIKAGGPGPPGEVWIQALSYANVSGSDGTGPDIAAVQLFFEIVSAGPNPELIFDLRLTSGDSIFGATSATFSDAIITAVPEPGTVVLLGLGFAGLSVVQRRGSHDSEDSPLARTI